MRLKGLIHSERVGSAKFFTIMVQTGLLALSSWLGHINFYVQRRNPSASQETQSKTPLGI